MHRVEVEMEVELGQWNAGLLDVLPRLLERSGGRGTAWT